MWRWQKQSIVRQKIIGNSVFIYRGPWFKQSTPPHPKTAILNCLLEKNKYQRKIHTIRDIP